MLKSALVTYLCLSLAYLNPSTAKAKTVNAPNPSGAPIASDTASPGLLTVSDVAGRSGTLSRQVLQKLDEPEARDRLAALGVSSDEAKRRVAALSDDEIRQMIGESGQEKAGGDIVISLTTVLLIIIIILLIRR